MTIHHVPGKSNVFTDPMLHCPDLVAVIGSIKSNLLTCFHQTQAAASGDSQEKIKKAGRACEHGFIFSGGLLCYTRGGNEVSLIIPEDKGLGTDLLWQFHGNPYGGHLGVSYGWCLNDIGGRDCMLMSNSIANSDWFARE